MPGSAADGAACRGCGERVTVLVLTRIKIIDYISSEIQHNMFIFERISLMTWYKINEGRHNFSSLGP